MIDVNQVKQYNSYVRAYKEKSARLSAEIDFNKRELINICNELSADLGIEVTPENIEQVYKERMEAIEQTLKSGTEVLNRIQQSEQAQVAGQTAGQVQAQVVGQVQAPAPEVPPVPGQVQPSLGGTPDSIVEPGVAAPISQSASQNSGSVFGNGGFSGFSDLPPIFAK